MLASGLVLQYAARYPLKLVLNSLSPSNPIASPISLYRCQRKTAYNPNPARGTTLALSIDIYIARLFLPVLEKPLDLT